MLRRWLSLRFSLKSLLLLFILVAVPLAMFATRVQKARLENWAVVELEKLGAIIRFDYQSEVVDR